MSNVKVLQIVGDPVGGIRKHVHDILNGLHSDFDFLYVTSKNGDKVFYSEIDELSKKIENYYDLDIQKKPSISDFSNILKIYKLIKRHKVDVVHGHGAKGGLYARLAGKLAGCKVIYTPHGGVVHNMFKPIEAKLYSAIEKFLCLFTDLLIFESNYTANSFNRKFGCKKVKKIVNYNGVEIPSGLPTKEIKNPNSWPKKIGVFGMLREEKGQDIAYDAIKSLISEGYQIQLHFYGDGPLKTELQNHAISDKLTSKIFFHGEVTNVYEKMLEMDFILIPSRFESFGYVAVEAAMLKVPIITSAAGGLAEIINHKSGFLFSISNAKSLMCLLSYCVILDIESLEKKVLLAYADSNKVFSIDSMNENIKKYYIECKNGLF